MKYISVLLLLFTLYLPAFAQDKVFHFGPKAGISLSDISNKPRIDPRVGYYAGLVFNIRLNSRWALQPEMYFSAQGAEGKLKDAAHIEHYNYLAFPILVQYHFANRLYLEGGVQAAFLVNGRLRSYQAVPEPGAPYTSRHENVFDFLIPVGAGYQLNRHFGFNIRYNQGITGIRRSALASEERNRVLQAGAYMYF
jgi:hypothetical protein